MSLQIRKKLINATTFWYLLKLDKTMSADPKKSKAIQNKNIHKLMKRAYEIPFYRKRFDENGLTPDDFHCSEVLPESRCACTSPSANMPAPMQAGFGF